MLHISRVLVQGCLEGWLSAGGSAGSKSRFVGAIPCA